MESPKENEDLHPAIIMHRSPDVHQFPLNYSEWLQPRFRLLQSSDPLFSILSKTARALICVGLTPVNSETFHRFPCVECVVGTSVGIDHIDLVECRRRGIKVTNAGDAFSEDVADYAVGLLIDVLRRISAADRYVRSGSWLKTRDYPLSSKLGGKRIGIVGLGSIGSMVATRLQAFGCIVTYNSRSKKPNVPYQYYSSVVDLASNSDALILCCAMTKETHHLINGDVLRAMGKKGVIINVGRGPLVDEKALVECLVRGQIGGAGLDVFENDPYAPKELFGLDNVVLSPHIAITTPESFQGLRSIIFRNLEAFFTNEPLVSQV